jgi:hypothetical protein
MAAQSATWNAMSARVSRALTGTATRPSFQQAKNVSMNSGQLPSQITTLSPAARPRSVKLLASASTLAFSSG